MGPEAKGPFLEVFFLLHALSTTVTLTCADEPVVEGMIRVFF